MFSSRIMLFSNIKLLNSTNWQSAFSSRFGPRNKHVKRIIKTIDKLQLSVFYVKNDATPRYVIVNTLLHVRALYKIGLSCRYLPYYSNVLNLINFSFIFELSRKRIIKKCRSFLHYPIALEIATYFDVCLENRIYVTAIVKPPYL